jgi:hypothetical protein
VSKRSRKRRRAARAQASPPPVDPLPNTPEAQAARAKVLASKRKAGLLGPTMAIPKQRGH